MIIVDAMGGDNAPLELVRGCIDGVEAYDIDKITLVGRELEIQKILEDEGAEKSRFEIIKADDIIYTDDPPVASIKNKKNSSMVKGLEYLQRDPNSVFISAGNTGALMVGSFLKVGRIRGIDRPALAPIIPTISDEMLLIDAGANADCKPENLEQFAIMGSVYMQKVRGKSNPRVGLINIGTEETKGNELTKAAFKRLKQLEDINFVGNIEARDILYGKVDILVCDGFVGNTILKLIEGVAQALFVMIKEEVEKNPITKLGAAISKPAFKNIKATMDYTEYGGAPLLGIDGGVIKIHGSSDRNAVKNAIGQAKLFIEHGVVSTIIELIGQLEGDIK